MHLHASHWHTPEVPVSWSIMGVILGVIVAPIVILSLLFVLGRALAGLP